MPPGSAGSRTSRPLIPSSLFNLFGLLPWDGPTRLDHGDRFPRHHADLLGVSMWLQQKLNPAPTDPVQKQIFAWMPWVFMFMLGSFASGLVLYWIANNMITFTQQYAIMRSHGYKPDVFGNIRESFKRGGAVTARAASDRPPGPDLAPPGQGPWPRAGGHGHAGSRQGPALGQGLGGCP